MNNLEKRTIWFFTASILIIILIIIVILIWLPRGNKNINVNTNTNIMSKNNQKVTVSVSPTGEFMALFENNALKVVNMKTNEKYVLQEYPATEEIHSLLWNNDGSRFYYAQTRSHPFVVTDFAYADVKGDYSFISTGIVPSITPGNAEIFMAEVYLVGVVNEVLYFQSGDSLYKMSVFGDGDIGGAPELIQL